jgi:hypothetical protein
MDSTIPPMFLVNPLAGVAEKQRKQVESTFGIFVRGFVL